MRPLIVAIHPLPARKKGPETISESELTCDKALFLHHSYLRLLGGHAGVSHAAAAGAGLRVPRRASETPEAFVVAFHWRAFLPMSFPRTS